MCRHIINAQVSIRAPCCRRWVDCAECHDAESDHPLLKSTLMTMACKRCSRVFRKDLGDFEEGDEYCPHCDNHYLLPAVEPKAAICVEFEEGQEHVEKDHRVKENRR
ncbi:MAG: CHY zinc finger domain-containing protein [Amphiamblys sp. WSBS2006]|nr:MAG: CHY zinc finger domain-containing protein [Amphiamblys sp. WSBS2006]